MTDFTVHKPTNTTADYLTRIPALIDAIDAEFSTAIYTNTSVLIELTGGASNKEFKLYNANAGFAIRMAGGGGSAGLFETNNAGVLGNRFIGLNHGAAVDIYFNNVRIFRSTADGFLNDVGSVRLVQTTIAGLAVLTPALHTGGFVWCTDETGGACAVISDGTNFVRVRDGVTAS